jgi:acetyl esterase/lipase
MGSWQQAVLRRMINLVALGTMFVPAHKPGIARGFQRLIQTFAVVSSVPRAVTIEQTTLAGVPCEWLTPPDAGPGVIMYIHGGGFVFGWTRMHRALGARLALYAGQRVLAVDYRLAPQHTFPVALDDTLAVYEALLDAGYDPAQLTVVGDSAGGNLALGLLLQARERDLPGAAALVCMSPVVDMQFSGPSMATARDPMIAPAFARGLIGHYIGDSDVRSPLLSPLHGDLSGLPPLLIHVGEDEVLRSDSERLAENTRAAGGYVEYYVGARLWHVWHLFAPYLPEAKAALADIATFIHRHVPESTLED